MLQSQMATSGPSQAPADSQEAMVEAPPKQVAMAMDRLAHAARLIADIRISADRFLEALFVAASLPHPLSDKPLRIILNQEESIRLHLHDLRSVGNPTLALFFLIFPTARAATPPPPTPISSYYIYIYMN